MSKVIKAIHETVVNGKMPSKAIASAIGKPYSTLLRETNPLDPGAKLGVETFIAIIEATGDSTPAQRDGAGTRLQACPCGLTASHERGDEHSSPRTMRDLKRMDVRAPAGIGSAGWTGSRLARYRRH